MDKSISPPPLKRQKRTHDPPAANNTHVVLPASTGSRRPTPGTLRIFSWNVNGIAPFVEPHIQKPIDHFFKPASVSSSSAADRKQRGERDGNVTSDSGDDEDVSEADGVFKEGKPSLRLTLKRYGWPHILFLQEVKIRPGDSKTMDALRLAVNDAPKTRGPPPVTDREAGYSRKPDDKKIKCLKDGGPEYDVYFNLPADRFNAKAFGGKVYGVATVVRRDFASRYVQDVRDVSWDKEGRLQIVETREMALPLKLDTSLFNNTTSVSISTVQRDSVDAKNSVESPVKFAIINIYAVNGTTKPYYSPYTGAEVGSRHDRKLALHTELLREARSLESNGFQVIIAGDLNVARSKLDGYPNLRTWPHQHVLNRADFDNKFFTSNPVDVTPPEATYLRTRSEFHQTGPTQGFDGIDTFRYVHGDERRYTYYPRGRPWGSSCDRVDLILASKSLSSYIMDAGICDDRRDRGPSDHCPTWVEIGIREMEIIPA